MGVNRIYMVIGRPGSGKSWVCEQLRNQYRYVRHDDYIERNYVNEIIGEARIDGKPLLIETPFSVSQIKDPLEAKGFHVTPVFIKEDFDVVRKRYQKREGKPIPEGHLTRQNTYAERAKLWQSYIGTSAEVLAYLRNAAPREKMPWET